MTVVGLAVGTRQSRTDKRIDAGSKDPVIAIVQEVREQSSKIRQRPLAQLVVSASNKAIAMPIKLAFAHVHTEENRLDIGVPRCAKIIGAGRRFNIIGATLVVI